MSDKSTSSIPTKIELPPSIDNAVQNLTDKPTQNIGTTMADIWFIVFGGISNFAEKKRIKYAHDLEQYRLEVEQAVSSIPSDKLLEPSLLVTAQALENSKYCVEEKELREMFTSLISKSMNSDFTNVVHPSFAEIIKQMSVLDAKIIRKFKDAPRYPICNYNLKRKSPGYQMLLENVFLELPKASLDHCSQSLSSLVRLGLIEIPEDLYLTAPDLYKPFEQHPWFLMLKARFPDDEIVVEKKVALLTPLGRSFIKVCIPD